MKEYFAIILEFFLDSVARKIVSRFLGLKVNLFYKITLFASVEIFSKMSQALM